MKIIRFTTQSGPNIHFGVVIQNLAVSFDTLQSKTGKSLPILSNSRSYLENLPDGEKAAKELLAWGESNIEGFGETECFPLDSVRLLEPIEITSLFDFGLTPRHLKNSAEVIGRYEKDNPQTAPLLQAFAKAVIAPKAKAPEGQPEALSYYKSNMNTIVGDNESIPWPAYTSRLDVEPELAVIYGNEKQPVAGFCVFNDISARDIQATEFVGGFCLTKDMAKGNQLGPYLVTLDEVGDPYNLQVTVEVNGQVKYRGSTSEISHKADDVFAWLGFIAPLKPGSVMGFGTIPDCTGCDHDDFIDPGSDLRVTIERLGTLRCRFEEPKGKLLPSRWPVREPLRKYH
ncbi:Ureidoglycolate lyase [Pirellula sp. SH-Sr6A]|uniref:fumarylacetoacetate hydrolase family protein n=1 Tax=Pirellula sp. SH-Sr6A TaxID=1632865 RepID=UPI00078E98B0|nr:fumarylacetoacetate hydrolase family protein [Pirellula sp. SH-Sr6A]AMV32440.1 Ureidoglycolate lyase [Pirellula sp. SH-Sr6A]